MKTSGACTDELIQKVAQNSDPESGITFEMLMDANGKVPRRMTGKYTSKEFEATEKNITDIIFKELEDRGYRTSILEGENKHNALNYRYRTDWVISTDANSDSGEMEIWEFEIWHTMLEKNSVAHGGYFIMANKISSVTKVVILCRISFANIFEAKSINGGEAKFSVSCLIPKGDKKTLLAIHKAVEAAKEDGKTRKWGGKIPPNLKLPLRDGDIDRPDDENYQEHFFLNATSKDAPQVVDRHVQPVTDPMMVYSGCFCNVSVNFYAFNANGNRGVAAGLGNIQFVKDGERLSGRASAESDFDALEDDEEVLGGGADEELPEYLC